MTESFIARPAIKVDGVWVDRPGIQGIVRGSRARTVDGFIRYMELRHREGVYNVYRLGYLHKGPVRTVAI